MLVFAGFTPHSPLLLPEVNKDKRHLVQKTTDAMRELADELYAAHPEVILLISEHPTVLENTFSLNVNDPYTFNLTSFGVLNIDHEFHPDLALVDKIQRHMRTQGQPLTLSTDETLNYASAVPLMMLAKKLPDVKLVAQTFSELPPKAHFQFGQNLKNPLFDSKKRIAVIASGDMSHALESESPAGFNKAGKLYDEKIQELVAQKNTAGLISLDKKITQDAQQTSYRPLTILFGMLERVSVSPEILSYEAPFGVGYLVANFALK